MSSKESQLQNFAQKYRSDFPILSRQVNGKPLVYLDNAATSQKPNQVVDAIADYYRNHNANVHRGIHQLGDESTKLFHASRQKIAEFFGARPGELVIVRNTTEAINFVASGWGESAVKAGDVILLTEMEHHSNLVPWQQLAQRKNARLEYVAVLPNGTLDQSDFDQKITLPNIKLFAITHVSNTLGTRNPIEEMIARLRRKHPDAKVCIDGAQAAPHLPINFGKIDADFYTVSAHKMLGPMGIGALLVRQELLATLQPFLVGGGMIDTVELQTTTFAEDLEERFTAGTPDVASLVGWAAACEYLQQIGMEKLLEYDQFLIEETLRRLEKVSQVQVVGPVTQADRANHGRVGSVAFVYNGVHAHDVGQILDSEGVAVRSGHHCTMPLHHKFEWPATVRVSFQLYNTVEELDVLVTGLEKVEQIFGK